MNGRRWLMLVAVLIGGVLMTRVLNNDYVTEVDADLTVVEASNVSGWVEDANTWTYSSADAPTFVISINADVTGYLSAGMRVRLTQTTVKYAIITAVGSYTAGATEITVYGGTDYTITSDAITSPGYSSYKAPFGFPMSRDKWSVEVVDTSTRTQATPSSGTWYNIGTTNSQINIPIGDWDISYQVFAGADLNLLTTNVYTTLSTANNTESNTHMTAAINVGINAADSLLIESRLVASDFLSLASKATYYLNAKTGTSGVPNIYFGGATIPTIIRAVCAYL